MTTLSTEFEILTNLNEVSNYQESFNFLKLFENRLFIYSPFVSKIYLDYKFIFPTSEKNNIAILPNHQNETSLVHNISNNYISDIPYISIMSADIINQSGTVIKVISPNNLIESKYIILDSNVINNVNSILNKFYDHKFNPIVITNGIRSFHNSLPAIDIYHLDLKNLKEDGIISELDKNCVGKFLQNGIKSILYGDLNDFKKKKI